MILLVFSAIGGGLLTSSLLWSQSTTLALMLAPFGGSIAAATAAAFVGWRASVRLANQNPTLDEQIAALRDIAALGRRLSAQDEARSEARTEAGSRAA